MEKSGRYIAPQPPCKHRGDKAYPTLLLLSSGSLNQLPVLFHGLLCPWGIESVLSESYSSNSNLVRLQSSRNNTDI